MSFTYDEIIALCKNNPEIEYVEDIIEWMLSRCILEYGLEEDFENGEIKEDRGKEKLIEFFKENFTEENIVEELKNDEDLQSKFSEFILHTSFGDGEVKHWEGHEESFIQKLKSYRKKGSLDKNIENKLLDFAKNINNDPLRYIYELIQNADDCEYGVEKYLTIEISEDCKKMTVSYPEKGMSHSDIIAITTIDQSSKIKRKKKKVIGEKGIGFKTIFSVCESADIHSNNYHFKLLAKSFAPEWIKDAENIKGTKLELNLKDNELTNKNIYTDIIRKYGVECRKIKVEEIIKNCPIFFTNKIEQIKIKYGKDELKITREMTDEDTMEVKYFLDGKGESEIKLIFNKFKKDIIFSWEEYRSHYKSVYKDEDEYNLENDELKKYSIILLALKKAENSAGEIDIKKDITEGNLFTYLPTYTSIKAPFTIQIPFELNQDRSCMLLQKHSENGKHEPGDWEGGTTLWNKRLFNETFISEEGNESLLKKALDKLKEEGDIFYYVPNYDTSDHDFFKSPEPKYNANIESINDYCKRESNNNIIFEEIKQIRILKKLNDEDYCSIDDEPIMFGEKTTEIIKGNVFELNDVVKYTLGGSDIVRDVVNFVDLEKYKNAVELGLKYEEIKEKENFANKLIELNRESFISNFDKLLNKEILGVNKKELKLIEMPDGKYISISDGELWIKTKGFNEACGCKLKILEFSKNEETYELLKKDFDSIIDIDSIDKESIKEIWDKVYEKIYHKTGNDEKINCSYPLFKDIMTLFAKLSDVKDWFEYTKQEIGSDDFGNELIAIWQNEEFIQEALEKCK